MKFRKKPVVIDAVRLSRAVTVHTLEGDHEGKAGDWLITGVKGEQYVCKDDIFRMTYEYVDLDGQDEWDREINLNGNETELIK